MAGRPRRGTCHICNIAVESPLGPPENTVPQGGFGVKFHFIVVKKISPGNEKVLWWGHQGKKLRPKVQITHFQHLFFQNRVIFILWSCLGTCPGGGLGRAPERQVAAVWDQVPPALFPYIRVLTCHQPPHFPSLLSLSSHPLSYFYNCPTNLLSLTLRSFPEGLSGRSVAYQTHFPFQNSLKSLPWACWVQSPCFITSCPSLSPLPLQGLEIIVWAWPSPGPSLGYHITWFENINRTNLASLSRFRTENPTQKTETVSCLNRAEGGCEKSERSVINKVNPWA